MATDPEPRPIRIFNFGRFELSEPEAEVRKNGVRLKLQEQPYRVLLHLVTNPGRVVTREELQQKLWPADTFVDFDVGLNTAVRNSAKPSETMPTSRAISRPSPDAAIDS